MATIVDNQRAAFVSRALTTGRRLADDLRNLSEAQQFAVTTTINAAIGLPVDSVMLTDDLADCVEAATILDGILARHPDERWAWHVSSGCYARIHLLPKEQIHA